MTKSRLIIRWKRPRHEIAQVRDVPSWKHVYTMWSHVEHITYGFCVLSEQRRRWVNNTNGGISYWCSVSQEQPRIYLTLLVCFWDVRHGTEFHIEHDVPSAICFLVRKIDFITHKIYQKKSSSGILSLVEVSAFPRRTPAKLDVHTCPQCMPSMIQIFLTMSNTSHSTFHHSTTV